MGLAPEALDALVRENDGAVASYGFDPVSERAADHIRQMLDCDAEIRFLFSGTAANAIALSMLTLPHEAVLTHADAHIVVDENGAPAFFGHGLTIQLLPGPSGLIDPGFLATALAQPSSINRPAPATLSLTQVTEYGALYDNAMLRAVAHLASAQGLKIHVDGARLANAAAAGFDVRELAKIGVDTLVLGGAKAGAGCVEALVLFDKALGRRLDNRLKQAGQIASKARTQVAPLLGLLESGAWISHAAHANAMARRLADAIEQRTLWPIAHPVQSNTVFVRVPSDAFARIIDAGWSVFRFSDGSTRFVCNWATTTEQIDELIETLENIATRGGEIGAIPPQMKSAS